MTLAVKDQAINEANDLIENTGLGLNRLSDAWIYSKLAPTTGRNPIFDRDAEAIHILYCAKNPSELIEITASIVFNYIYLVGRRTFFRLNIFKKKWNAKIKPKLSKGIIGHGINGDKYLLNNRKIR